mgnify:CR=1 FL=1
MNRVKLFFERIINEKIDTISFQNRVISSITLFEVYYISWFLWKKLKMGIVIDIENKYRCPFLTGIISRF